MNHSVEDLNRDINPEYPSKKQKSFPGPAWIGPGGLIAFTLIKYSWGLNNPDLIVNFLATTLSFFLAVYLYYALSSLVYNSRNLLFWAAVAVSVAIVVATVKSSLWYHILVELAVLIVTCYLSGRMLKKGVSAFKVYLLAFFIIAAGQMIIYGPQLMNRLDELAELLQQNLQSWKSSLISMGIDPIRAEETVEFTGKVMRGVNRLMPASIIMTAIIQFSLGYLWFLWWGGYDRQQTKHGIKSFYEWRMPFAFTPVLILFIALRLVGGEKLQLVADNGLCILSIYYCLTGLALIEFLFKKANVHLILRIIFYIFLLITGIFGFAGTALLGFVDSFIDWRNRFRLTSRELK